MKGSDILNHVDHTLLKATASWSEIQAICEESIACKTASICIPPSYVKRIHDLYGTKINICTVIGFPLGYNTTEVKLAETKQALAEGANEIDMVINIGDIKNKDYTKVTEEIHLLKTAVGKNKILKVIIETCYLTAEEKRILCEAVTNAGADFIKTSTGFGTNGAVHEDILLFKKHIGQNVKIKAAGGIHSVEDMKQFIEEGCSRIGASSAVKLLKDKASTEF
ncbi:MAG: deoxyribose-phosphate aldolase [Selenomonadaceae bacterium]